MFKMLDIFFELMMIHCFPRNYSLSPLKQHKACRNYIIQPRKRDIFLKPLIQIVATRKNLRICFIFEPAI